MQIELIKTQIFIFITVRGVMLNPEGYTDLIVDNESGVSHFDGSGSSKLPCE